MDVGLIDSDVHNLHTYHATSSFFFFLLQLLPRFAV